MEDSFMLQRAFHFIKGEKQTQLVLKGSPPFAMAKVLLNRYQFALLLLGAWLLNDQALHAKRMLKGYILIGGKPLAAKGLSFH